MYQGIISNRIRARDGTRTRGPDLGKVVLHQLSHSRTYENLYICISDTRARDGTRTRGPDLGKVVLHQLSHSRIYEMFMYLFARHI